MLIFAMFFYIGIRAAAFTGSYKTALVFLAVELIFGELFPGFCASEFGITFITEERLSVFLFIINLIVFLRDLFGNQMGEYVTEYEED